MSPSAVADEDPASIPTPGSPKVANQETKDGAENITPSRAKLVALDVRDLDPVKFGDELEAARKEHERRLKHTSACELDSEDEAECYIQYVSPQAAQLKLEWSTRAKLMREAAEAAESSSPDDSNFPATTSIGAMEFSFSPNPVFVEEQREAAFGSPVTLNTQSTTPVSRSNTGDSWTITTDVLQGGNQALSPSQTPAIKRTLHFGGTPTQDKAKDPQKGTSNRWGTALLFILGILAGCVITQYSGVILETMTTAGRNPSTYLPSTVSRQLDWSSEYLAKGRSDFAAWLDRVLPHEAGFWHCSEQDSSMTCFLKDKIRGIKDTIGNGKSRPEMSLDPNADKEWQEVWHQIESATHHEPLQKEQPAAQTDKDSPEQAATDVIVHSSEQIHENAPDLQAGVETGLQALREDKSVIEFLRQEVSSKAAALPQAYLWTAGIGLPLLAILGIGAFLWRRSASQAAAASPEEVKPALPQTGKKQADPRSPHGGQEIFATPAIHSPVPSTPTSSMVSGEQGSRSQLPAEETSDVSSGSDKAVSKHTAKKSRQIPALAHDIELRNRKILMDQQNKMARAGELGRKFKMPISQSEPRMTRSQRTY